VAWVCSAVDSPVCRNFEDDPGEALLTDPSQISCDSNAVLSPHACVLSFGGLLGIGDDHYPLPGQRYDQSLGDTSLTSRNRN
jgi:hypothetical protein